MAQNQGTGVGDLLRMLMSGPQEGDRQGANSNPIRFVLDAGNAPPEIKQEHYAFLLMLLLARQGGRAEFTQKEMLEAQRLLQDSPPSECILTSPTRSGGLIEVRVETPAMRQGEQMRSALEGLLRDNGISLTELAQHLQEHRTPASSPQEARVSDPVTVGETSNL